MRVRRFLHLYKLIRIMKIKMPTYYFKYGDDIGVKNIWNHAKDWRFNWE